MMEEGLNCRIGFDERERALRELSSHFADGRLSSTEFDHRSAAVWAAVTKRHLAELFADLPSSPPTAATVFPARRSLRVLLAGVSFAAVVVALFSGVSLWLLVTVVATVLAVAWHRQ